MGGPSPLLDQDYVNRRLDWIIDQITCLKQSACFNMVHNNLPGLQGGNATLGEFYHLDADQHAKVSSLVAGNMVLSVSGDTVDNTDPKNPIIGIPTFSQVIAEGGNLNISQLTNNGDGTSPFVTEADVENFVQSVTGNIVDNTDPANPIVITPTLQEVMLAGSFSTITSNYNITTQNNQAVISIDAANDINHDDAIGSVTLRKDVLSTDGNGLYNSILIQRSGYQDNLLGAETIVGIEIDEVRSSLNVGRQGIEFIDDIWGKGVSYFDDYSANYTSLSIPHLGHIQTLIGNHGLQEVLNINSIGSVATMVGMQSTNGTNASSISLLPTGQANLAGDEVFISTTVGNVNVNPTGSFNYNGSQVINEARVGAINGVASLDGNGKVPLSQINDALLGNVNYQGLWNASTNSPDLTVVAPKGHYYIVSVAGTQFSKSFEIGDWIVSNGTTWDKVDNTDAVSSVNGQTGNVSLAVADIVGLTAALATKATIGGDAKGTTVTLGATDGFGLNLIGAGNTYVFNSNGFNIPTTKNIGNFSNLDYFQLNVGSSSQSGYIERELADSSPAFRIRNAGNGSTGDIVQFQSYDIGSVATITRAGVRVDGRTYGTNGTASNDYITKGQLDSNIAVTDGIEASGTGPITLGLVVPLKSDFSTNTFVGLNAGLSNTYLSSTQGAQNTFIGTDAGRNNTTGYAQDAVGFGALYKNTTGNGNVALGYQALFENITNSFNTAVGTDAGYRNTGDRNNFFGHHSGKGVVGSTYITGSDNMYFGWETGTLALSGSFNTFFGNRAGFSQSTGSSNSAFGYLAGFGLTTGSMNVLSGREAGQALTTQNNNVFTGYRAGYNATSAGNTGIGFSALFNLTTGSSNTALGSGAGDDITTGSSNTFIGVGSGNNASQLGSANFSTAIGYNSYTTKSNQMVLGASNITETLLRGTVLLNTETDNAGGAKLQVNGRISASDAVNSNEVVTLNQAIIIEPTSPTSVKKLWYGTQAQYEALGVYDSNVNYMISDAPNPYSITNNTTTALSMSDLNTAYPTAVDGFEVKCPLITGAPAIYKKTDNANEWLAITATIVV